MKQFIIEIHFKDGIEIPTQEELALLDSMLTDIVQDMLEQDTKD